MLAYIIAAYLWWMILLLNKNDESLSLHSANYFREYLQTHEALSFEDFKQTDEYKLVFDKHQKQEWMILGEGIVFLSLIIILGWRVIISFKKEIDLNRAQKNFLLSITHELKSPLASIKLSLQTLEVREQMEADKKAKLIQNALFDINRLQGMVDNLLLSARIESAAFQTELNTTNLSQLTQNIADHFKRTSGKNRELQCSIDNDVFILGDEPCLISIVSNQLENALKYSAADTAIELILKKKGGFAELIVSDKGIGIKDNEKQKVFDKFYRVGNEETRKTKGSGLGLYIVKELVALHKGNIQISNNTPQGTRFEIQFPLIKT
jgi:signal transduction histidine kinase